MSIRLSLPFLGFLVALGGCSTTDGPSTAELPARPGLTVVESNTDVNQAISRVETAIDTEEGVALVAEVNHSRNAQGVAGSLRPTRLALVSIPGIDGSLLQQDQRVGLDLPHKLLVYEDEDGRTIVGYNTLDYLTARYNVGGAVSLGTLTETLSELATVAAGAGEGALTTPAAGITTGEGIVSVESDSDVIESYRRLRTAIQSNPNLSIEAEMNLQGMAQAAGFQVRPTQLIVFSNPRVGTPVMEASQTAALDLPLKMLIYQNAAGRVLAAYTDPAFLAERHDVPASLEEIEQMQAALAQLAEIATDRFARHR